MSAKVTVLDERAKLKAFMARRMVKSIEEAAAYLQVHKATVYKYVRSGLLPAARLGKVYRLLRRDVDAFLETMKLRRSR